MWLQDTGFLGQQRVPRENARWKEVGTSPERARAVGSQQQPPVFPGPESPVKTRLPTQGPGAGVGGGRHCIPHERPSQRGRWPGDPLRVARPRETAVDSQCRAGLRNSGDSGPGGRGGGLEGSQP